MKYSVILQERRGAASLEDAERIVGGPRLLELARKAGWIAPAVCSNRLTLFDYDDCLACWKRIRAEGFEALKQAAKEVA